MCTPVKRSAHLTGLTFSKRMQAKLSAKKKKWAFIGTFIKRPAHLSGADIFKEDTGKAKFEKKRSVPSWVRSKAPCSPYWVRHFQRGYRQS